MDQMHILYEQERRQDMVRQAERRRLLRQAWAGREKSRSLRSRLFAWLGRRLIAWGRRLQTRYDEAEAAAQRLEGPEPLTAPRSPANG